MKTILLKKATTIKRLCRNCGKDISDLPENKEFCCRSCLLVYSHEKLRFLKEKGLLL